MVLDNRGCGMLWNAPDYNELTNATNRRMRSADSL